MKPMTSVNRKLRDTSQWGQGGKGRKAGRISGGGVRETGEKRGRRGGGREMLNAIFICNWVSKLLK